MQAVSDLNAEQVKEANLVAGNVKNNVIRRRFHLIEQFHDQSIHVLKFIVVLDVFAKLTLQVLHVFVFPNVQKKVIPDERYHLCVEFFFSSIFSSNVFRCAPIKMRPGARIVKFTDNVVYVIRMIPNVEELNSNTFTLITMVNARISQ